MAIWRPGKPDAPLHHSDRRSQYTREKFLKLLSDHPLLDEPFGQRLGQRRDGELLLVAQERANSSQTYRIRDEAKAGRSITSNASKREVQTLDDRLPAPSGVRRLTEISLGCRQPNRVQAYWI
jgi:hypothetical protein